MPSRVSYEAVFQPEFREDLRAWIETDRRVALRVLDLVEAVLRDPFTGIGKPEPLKYLLAGCWSRRVTQEHRLVYRVAGRQIDFLQAKYHYCPPQTCAHNFPLPPGRQQGVDSGGRSQLPSRHLSFLRNSNLPSSPEGENSSNSK